MLLDRCFKSCAVYPLESKHCSHLRVVIRRTHRAEMRNNNIVKEDHENKILRRNTSSDRIKLLTGNCRNKNPHRLRHVSRTGLFPQKLGGPSLFLQTRSNISSSPMFIKTTLDSFLSLSKKGFTEIFC